MRTSNSWRKNGMQLDKIAASRMHLPPHIALSNLPSGIYRIILKSSGINEKSEPAKLLLDCLDELGSQEMLRNQPVSIRYSASYQHTKKKRVHGASE